jgi:hypothetical protein
MRLSIRSLLAFAVVAFVALYVGQVPVGNRTVGAYVVEETQGLTSRIGQKASQHVRLLGERGRRDAATSTLSSRPPAVEPSDDDLVTDSDRRSLMRLLQ